MKSDKYKQWHSNGQVDLDIDGGKFLTTQTVEANLLYDILEQLEELENVLENIESGVNPR